MENFISGFFINQKKKRIPIATALNYMQALKDEYISIYLTTESGYTYHHQTPKI